MNAQDFLTLALLVPVVCFMYLFVEFILTVHTPSAVENPLDISEVLDIVYAADEPKEMPVEEYVEEECKTATEYISIHTYEMPKVSESNTIRELKAIAGNWNKANPEAKIKKWDRMTKAQLIEVLNSR